MSDRDPLSALTLEPGERVLWQGRSGVSVPWSEVRGVARGGCAAWLTITSVLVVLILFNVALRAAGGGLDSAPQDRGLAILGVIVGVALLVGVVVVPMTGALMLARAVGGHVLPLLVLAFGLPAVALVWIELVWKYGWIGAVQRLPAGWYLAAALIVALPTLRVVSTLLGRLRLVYALTDRRGVAVRLTARGARVEWTAALLRNGKLQARVVRPRGTTGRRGHIVFGAGRDRREMSMVLDPERALEDVRAALGR